MITRRRLLQNAPLFALSGPAWAQILPQGRVADYRGILGAKLLRGWDAEIPSTITIATGVSAWAPMTGGSNVTQSTGAAQPAYSATSFGGGAAITFDGVDDFLERNLGGELPTGGATGEIWLLYGVAVSPPITHHIVAYGSTAANTARRISTSTAERINSSVGTGTAGVNVGPANTINALGRHFVRLRVGETNSRLYVDGLLDASAEVIPNTTASRLRLGASAAVTAASFFAGQIALVLFTTLLAPAQVNALNAYMQYRRRL